METSVLLAKLIGPILIVTALGALLNRTYYEQVFIELADSRLAIFLIGFLALVMGSLILRFHNVWTADWRVLITAIGWLSIFRGLFATLAPRSFMAFGRRYVANSAAITLGLVGTLLIGILLTYAGYAND